MAIKSPTPMNPGKPRVAVRACIYRDNPGFSVTGRGQHGGKVNIFCRTREGAEKIRDAHKIAYQRNDDTWVTAVINAVFDAESLLEVR